MNYFVYNGIRSSDMGIKISGKTIFSAPKYDLAFQAIPGRDGELISPNGRFPNITLSYTCFIPAQSIQELSEKITAVKAWLYTEPDRYHTLSDSYDTVFFRKAVFNSNPATDGIRAVHKAYKYRGGHLLFGRNSRRYSHPCHKCRRL